MPKSPSGKKSRTKKQKALPYIRGFKPPTKTQQLKAIGVGPISEDKKVEAEFSPEHFEPISKCTSRDDWLAQYKEEGQTFEQFTTQCPWLSNRRRKYMKQKFDSTGKDLPAKYPDGRVYILPLGDFPTGRSPKIADLAEYAQQFLGLPVQQLPPVNLIIEKGKIFWERTNGDGNKTSVALKARYNRKSDKYQLCVDGGLIELKGIMPDDGICMIALTMCDLFEATSDLFVAGMAAGRDRVAIFSLLRYDPNLTFSKEFWFDMKVVKTHKQDERLRLLLLRSCRLLVHEINHLLGIDHCIYYSCCMNGSGHLEEDFRQPMFLCPVDLRKLQLLCGFDILNRYKNLMNFVSKHKMTEEVQWLSKRIASIPIACNNEVIVID